MAMRTFHGQIELLLSAGLLLLFSYGRRRGYSWYELLLLFLAHLVPDFVSI